MDLNLSFIESPVYLSASTTQFFVLNIIFLLATLIVYPIFQKIIKKFDDELSDEDRSEKHLSTDNSVHSNPLAPYKSVLEKFYVLITFKNYFISFIALFLFRSLEFIIRKYGLDFFTTFTIVCFIQLIILFIWKIDYNKKSNKQAADTKKQIDFNINDMYDDVQHFLESIKSFLKDLKSFKIRVPIQLFLTMLIWAHFYSYTNQHLIISLITAEIIFILPSILNYKKIRRFFTSNSEKKASGILFIPFYFLVVFFVIIVIYKLSAFMFLSNNIYDESRSESTKPFYIEYTSKSVEHSINDNYRSKTLYIFGKKIISWNETN